MKAGSVGMGGGLSNGEMGENGAGWPERGVLGRFESLSACWLLRGVVVDVGAGVDVDIGIEGSMDVVAVIGVGVGVGGPAGSPLGCVDGE